VVVLLVGKKVEKVLPAALKLTVMGLVAKRASSVTWSVPLDLITSNPTPI
jgi:hypothetical protein